MFENIFGHENVKNRLETVIRSKRLSNAYLFAGPPSVGKYTVAREFSLEILGKQFKKDIDADIFPDLLTVFPFLKKDLNSNAATYIDALREVAQNREARGKMPRLSGNESIPIDLIREIIIFAQKQAYIASKKVIIITNAEKMRKEAANSFLKILEEPPADTVFILITDNLNSILPTIISRCQLIKFGYLRETDIAACIQAQNESIKDASHIAWFFDGTLENVQSAGSAISEDVQKELVDMFIECDMAGTLKALELAGTKGKNKKPAVLSAAYYIKLIMRFLLETMTQNYTHFEKEQYMNAEQAFSREAMQNIFDELHVLESDIRKNIGPREIITRIISCAHAEKEVINVCKS